MAGGIYVPGTTTTALLVGAETIKVSAHPAHTAHTRVSARDREPLNSIPNPVSTVNSLPRFRDSTGEPRDGSAAVENESLTHPVDRNAAVTDSNDRGLLHSVNSVNAVMNAA